MSEFDEDLARAVEDGAARGRLPGAADAIRRGRTRSRRAGGGAAVLGVAAIGGAFGLTAGLGGFGTGTRPATTPEAGVTTGHSASVPASSAESAPGSAAEPATESGHGDGLLPADLWPEYGAVHWNPQPAGIPGVIKSVTTLVTRCDVLTAKTFPVTGWRMWSNTLSDTPHHEYGDESVYTFPDEAGAAAFLADARQAGSVPACGDGPTDAVPAPGVGTGYGVSWLVTRRDSGIDHLPSTSHTFLVQVGDRVAVVRVMAAGGGALQSTAGDAKLLAELRDALLK